MEHLADGVNLKKHERSAFLTSLSTYANLLTNLLVDDDVNQRTRGSNALVGTDEVFERQRTDKFLGIRLTSGPLSARYTTYITKKKVPSNEFTQLVVIKE